MKEENTMCQMLSDSQERHLMMIDGGSEVHRLIECGGRWLVHKDIRTENISSKSTRNSWMSVLLLHATYLICNHEVANHVWDM